MLMHLYAQTENETAALELMERFDERDSTQFLLPLSILYFKKQDFKKAQTYLKRLARCNPDTKDFIADVLFDEIEDRAMEMWGGIGYSPSTIEELVIAYGSNFYLYAGAGAYFEWAMGVLK